MFYCNKNKQFDEFDTHFNEYEKYGRVFYLIEGKYKSNPEGVVQRCIMELRRNSSEVFIPNIIDLTQSPEVDLRSFFLLKITDAFSITAPKRRQEFIQNPSIDIASTSKLLKYNEIKKNIIQIKLHENKTKSMSGCLNEIMCDLFNQGSSNPFIFIIFFIIIKTDKYRIPFSSLKKDFKLDKIFKIKKITELKRLSPEDFIVWCNLHIKKNFKIPSNRESEITEKIKSENDNILEIERLIGEFIKELKLSKR